MARTLTAQARDVMADASQRLLAAAEQVTSVFPEHASELADLKPAFWMAIGALAVSGGPAVIANVVRETHRALGSPGDFGYGTPCGDALKRLYDATSSFLQYQAAFEGLF